MLVWRRAVQVLRDSNRWRPALRCTAVPGRCARVHKHLLARSQIPWAGQPHKLPAEVCLESTAGLDAVGHRHRIFLHAARTRRDLHMQRARRARTVRHDDHRKLPIKGSLELLAGPNTGGDRDREGLHHRVGAASHGGLRSSCRTAEGGRDVSAPTQDDGVDPSAEGCGRVQNLWAGSRLAGGACTGGTGLPLPREQGASDGGARKR